MPDGSDRRTDLAEDRTLLANERTYSSWMGTGMGAVGVAIGLKAVFGAFEPTWAAKAVATIFIFAAILIFWAARQQAHRTYGRMSESEAELQHPRRMTFLSATLSVGAVGTGIILWML